MTQNEVKAAYTRAQELYTELVGIMWNLADHYEQEGDEEMRETCASRALDLNEGDHFTEYQAKIN